MQANGSCWASFYIAFTGDEMSDTSHNPTNGNGKTPQSRRRSVLDLAPLELDCMNTLWPLGEATVRDIRDGLAQRRPRAYTTIMTIMDRLARKGVVERRKSGRAYIYRARLTADEARSQALTQLIDNFFAGSKAELLARLQPLPSMETLPPDGANSAPAVRAMAAAADYTK